MAANLGRDWLIKKNAVVLAGLRTKGVAFAGEPVDVTGDDEGGYRTLLATAGQVSLDLSIEGLTKDAVLRESIMTQTDLMLTDITVEYPDGATLSGNFFLSSLEDSGTYNDAITFSGSMQSSGPWVYTPFVAS